MTPESPAFATGDSIPAWTSRICFIDMRMALRSSGDLGPSADGSKPGTTYGGVRMSMAQRLGGGRCAVGDERSRAGLMRECRPFVWSQVASRRMEVRVLEQATGELSQVVHVPHPQLGFPSLSTMDSLPLAFGKVSAAQFDTSRIAATKRVEAPTVVNSTTPCRALGQNADGADQRHRRRLRMVMMTTITASSTRATGKLGPVERQF